MHIPCDNHTHPLAHDPHRIYTDEILDEWIQIARERSIQEVTFTDHDRFCDGVRFDVFERARDRAGESLRLNMGIELDNDPESSKKGYAWTRTHYNQLDFVLGSIHFIGDWPYDHPDHIEEFRKWNITDLYKTYFKEIQRIARDDIYDCLAHLDLIKIFNFFPEEDITSILDETLEIIREQGLTIELNCAGWHKPVKEQYPSVPILRMAVKKGIPLTVSSDAHAPSQLGRTYREAGEILEELGVEEVAVFRSHTRIMLPLK